MINRNVSSIFKDNVPGYSEEATHEDPSQFYEERVNRDISRGPLKGLQPIDFNDKVMGGMNVKSFLAGKIPEMGGAEGYNNKVNRMLGNNDKGSMSVPIDKILGSNKHKKSFDMFNSVKDSIDMNKFIGRNTSSKTIDVGSMLGMGSSHKSKKDKETEFDMSSFFKFNNETGFGKRAFEGLNSRKSSNKINEAFSFSTSYDNAKKPIKNIVNKSKYSMLAGKQSIGQSMNKINSMLGNSTTNSKFSLKNANYKISEMLGHNVNKVRSKNKTNIDVSSMIGMNNLGIKDTDKKINNMFGTFGNPEKIATKRAVQQNGLPMFGDFDGDKLANILDCDPLNPLKQGESHNPEKYLEVSNEDKSLVPVEAQVVPYNEDPNFVLSEGTPVNEDEIPMQYFGTSPDTFAQSRDESGHGNWTGGTGSILNRGEDPSIVDAEFETAPENSEKENVTEKGFFGKVGDYAKAKVKGSPVVQAITNNPLVQMATGESVENVLLQEELAKQNAKQKSKVSDTNVTNGTGSEERLGKINQQIAALNVQLMKTNMALKSTSNPDERKALKAEIVNIKYSIERLEASKKGELGLEKLRTLDIPRFEFEKEMAQKKFRAAQTAGEMAMFEKKLRSGSNMLGSLIGGTSGKQAISQMEKMAGIGKSADLSSKNVIRLTGSDGADKLKMMANVGGDRLSPPYGMKVAESVGVAGGLMQAPKSYSDIVGESVGKPLPTDLQPTSFREKVTESIGDRKNIAALRKEKEEQRQAMMQHSQPTYIEPTPSVTAPIPQVARVQTPMQQQPQAPQPTNFQMLQQIYAQQAQGRQPSVGVPSQPGVNPQGTMTDAQYQEYLKESAGEVTYRRGPYKKRQPTQRY